MSETEWLRAENRQLNADIARWQEEVGNMRAERETLRREVDRLRQLMSHSGSSSSVAASLAAKDEEIGRLRGELARLQYLASSMGPAVGTGGAGAGAALGPAEWAGDLEKCLGTISQLVADDEDRATAAIDTTPSPQKRPIPSMAVGRR